MRQSLIKFAESTLINSFEYLQDFGYELIGTETKEDEYVVRYSNGFVKKEINFSISDNEDLHRFLIVASIIREPYLTVNDFVSFNVFLRGGNILFNPILEGDQICEELIEKYIIEYAALFYKYGIPLIESGRQFPGYYPEWT